MQVARIDANKWAVSVRGFNGRFANKLLVLMDGRSVYTPLFSGVIWDIQDTMLADIDRIEVIRGPGAAVWGANAVNGVINIITKSASDTQGGLATAHAGNLEKSNAALRYGAPWERAVHTDCTGSILNGRAVSTPRAATPRTTGTPSGRDFEPTGSPMPVMR